MVPTSGADPVNLATDVHLPAGSGPWPVILHRTPYGRGVDASQFINRGYALVVQDVRGKGGSQGVAEPFLHDAWCENQDGVDTVAWIRSQPWSNGLIGTYGDSAPGITSLLLSGTGVEGQVCQFVGVASSDVFAQAMFQGGAFRQSLVENWLSREGLLDFRAMIVENPTYGDPWTCVKTETRFENIHAASVFWGGWYDIFLQGTIHSYVGIRQQGIPEARPHQRLVIGPWTHGRTSGQLVYPGAATPPAAYADLLKWMDYWLKGSDWGISTIPPVCYYLMGDTSDSNAPANRWILSETWPVAARPAAFYLREGGLLSPEPPAGSEPPETFTYDPLSPVPTRGGANLFPGVTGGQGTYDQRSVEGRSDVLVYTSAVVEEPFTITGPVTVHLWVSSSAVDTDFTAKLTDVYPDGRSMLVCDGILRMRHRNGLDSAELMEPGSPYEIVIDLWETALVFNAGHRIRLAVSSSNAPRFQPNPNTGEIFGQETHTLVAENTVFHSADQPSSIQFQVPDAVLDVSDADLDFGDVPGGEEELRLVDLRNTGKAALTLRAVQLADETHFGLETPALPAHLAPGGSVRLQVRYHPTGAGVHSSSLRIESNAVDPGTIDVSLTGRSSALPFQRGDSNADNAVDIADAIFILSYLFANVPAPSCEDAADSNDDGEVDISDTIFVLQFLFLGGPVVPLPYTECDIDPTVDELGCSSYDPCEGQ